MNFQMNGFLSEISDKSNINNIIKSLNNINIVYISRKLYLEKSGDILVKTKDDNKQSYFDLYIPENLQNGDVIFLIEFLSKFFNLDKSCLNNLLSYTKIATSIILKVDNQTQIKDIEYEVKNYGITNDFLEKIKNYKIISNKQTKDFIRLLKSKREKDYSRDFPKLGTIKDDIKNSKNILSEKLDLELYLTFLRGSINDLRYGLETIDKTQNEILIEYCEDPKNGFLKSVDLENNTIIFSKNIDGKKEIITIRNFNNKEKSEKLRDKIQIDKLKKELISIRETKNIEEIQKKELEIVNIIANDVYNGVNYYLVNDETNNGDKINFILKNSLAICVGFSIIGHAFLQELGIKHNILNIKEHSAIEVCIGDKLYFLDMANYNKLYLIKEIGVTGVYKKRVLEGLDYEFSSSTGDNESVIL